MNAVTILLLVILVVMLGGFYLIFTSGRKPSVAPDDAGVRIIGSQRSIVSVRKVNEPGVYEVRVEDAPMLDLYDEGLFLEHEESLLDRWMRTDISAEERRLLAEEIRMRHGLELKLPEGVEEEPAPQEAAEEPEAAEEEVDPESLEPVKGGVNRFEGYDPFGVRDPRAEALMEFVTDSYRRGFLRPEVFVYACETYGGGTAAVDLDLLRRECGLGDRWNDPELEAMSLGEFDIYVHKEAAAAMAALTDDGGDDMTGGDDGAQGQEPAPPEEAEAVPVQEEAKDTEEDAAETDARQEAVQEVMQEAGAPVRKGYSWDELGDE